MAEVGSSFFIVSDRPRLGEPQTGPIVVWLRGEHDISTDGALSLVLARAMALDCEGLVLDLSEVEFMACSTLETIVRAREYLCGRSAWLTVRSPSVAARRVIDACHLTDLLEPNGEAAGEVTGEALGSWVAVPTTPRSDEEAAPPIAAPDRAPVGVGRPGALIGREASAYAPAETA
jgi:anti-anti-sigma factor